MENDELEKYRKLVAEISDLKYKIEKYLHSNSSSIDDMTYGEAIKKLASLRAKQRMAPKSIREKYVK